MDKTDKIIYLLAMLVAKGTEMTPEDVLDKIPRKETKVELDQATDDMDVEMIYSLYPTKCPVSERATGKCTKDKKKIAKLLKKHNVEELRKIIEDYVSECRSTNTYIKNFSTFLNNLPDSEADTTLPLVTQERKYR